jgi:hypothetical protein
VAAGLALLGSWVVVFGPALVQDRAPFYRDQLLTLLPIREYLHARLRSGELPRWYPYEAMGVPFIGQIITATFHPQTLLFLAFSPLWALKLNTLLAYLLAVLGAYRASRALGVRRSAAVLAGIAFELGGYALGASHNLVYLMGHATLPWVLWAALRVAQVGRRRHVAALGVFWALVFLAGDAQSFALAALLVLAACFIVPGGRAAVWKMGAAGVLAVLLVSVELLPAFALSRDAIRQVGRSDPLLGRIFSLHPLRLPELLLPNPIPDALRVEVTGPLFQDGGALWATTLFAGISVLLLAGLALSSGARAAWGLAAISGVGLLLAMGDRGGLLPLVWKIFPLLTKFRFPEKYVGLTWVGLCPLAALGMEQLAARKRLGAAVSLGVAGALLALALLAGRGSAVAQVFAWRGHPVPSDGDLATAVAGAWQRGMLTSAGFAALLGLLAMLLDRRRQLLAFVPLLTFAELALANARHLPLAPIALLQTPTSFVQRVLESSAPGQPGPRVISEAGGRAPRLVTGADLHWVRVMRQLLRVDESGRWGIGSIGLNLPATTRRSVRLLGPNANRRAAVGPMLGACYRVLDQERAPPETDGLLLEDPEARLSLLSTECRPRAYLARARSIPSEAEALTAVHAGVPPGAAIWEGGPELLGGDGTVSWETYAPEHIVLRVEARAPAALVVSDELTQGWESTVDGVPAPMYYTQIALRGVPLSQGKHRVEMRYHTPLLAIGSSLSLLAVSLVLALIFSREQRGLEQREPKPGLDRRGGWPIASSASSEPAPRLCPPQDFAAQCAPMPVAPPCWTSAVSSD